ncbi:DUF6504 family protein [Nocardioides yefusunii]|uniref:DUF6504 family protein n=1 Tax=Nocardioides yefusunii TaxID=2500546 RepID=A0ABW1QY33_9ACTN|nr:DUF6504 family protein [Nocardioides yefusunii]
MRRYDDQVEVRTEEGRQGRPAQPEPAQFLWRGQLWQVRDVLAHWIETGEWWRSDRARAVAGTEVVNGRTAPGVASAPAEQRGPAEAFADLLREREVWRVEARRPEIGTGERRVVRAGVFDLAHDHAAGRWQLVSCSD